MSLLEVPYAYCPKIHPLSGWRRPPGRPRKTWLHQIGDGSAASTAKNGTLQSDVDIPGERDWRYGRPLAKHSDNDDHQLLFSSK